MYFRHDKRRLGQDSLIEDMKAVLNHHRVGLFEAPTGLGKTDSALSQAILFAKEQNKKVFFVTPKNLQHKLVVDIVNDINKKFNFNLKVMDFIGKSNLCIDPFLFSVGPEFYDLCEKKIKKGQCDAYDNVISKSVIKKKQLEHKTSKFLNENKHSLHAEEFREKCIDFNLCPYEFSLHIGKEADIFVVDVNHIFIPTIRSGLFAKLGIELEDCIFIFDEAHNLASRIRTILSDSLSIKQIEACQKEWEKCPKDELYDITEFLETLHYKFSKLKEGFISHDYFVEIFMNADVLETLSSCSGFILEQEKKKSNLAKVGEFIVSWLNCPNVKTKFKREETVFIKGLDPSFLTKDVFENASGCILMSATFSPLQMYADVLGIKNSFLGQYKSPFPKENKLVMCVDTVTTKFEERKESIPEISNIIANTVNKVSGNIAVFFPSYDILNSVFVKTSEKIAKKIFVQEQKQTPQQTKRMLDNFKKNKSGFGSVLFAVVGGSFSEGVDYPGDELIGVIMVGLPFPEPDFEINALIEFYNKNGLNGWDYAYLFPTISRVVQACGRAIRSETDKAFFLLLDKRYLWSKYTSLLPTDYNLQRYNEKKFTDFLSNL